MAAAGFRYVSSKAWGPDWSLPALLEHPFAYADDGHPELLELPCSGWHENVLKGNTWAGQFTRLIAFPAPYPEATPLRPVETPEEEFAINKAFIDVTRHMTVPKNVFFVYPYQHLCPDDVCVVSEGGMSNFFNFNHLTFAGGEGVAREVEQIVRP